MCLTRKLHGNVETSMFLVLVTKVWNILNIKYPDAGKNLNEENWMKFEATDDPRLNYLQSIANSFKEMGTANTGYSQHIKCLTSDTSKALFITLSGIGELIPLLLNKGARYILPGEFQSDRLEGEFGIYRQQSGGSYYISLDQVLSSLDLQRLKLFKKLSIEPSSVHQKEECCEKPLDDNELECLDTCFEDSSELSDLEKSTLYYIAMILPVSTKLHFVNSILRYPHHQHTTERFGNLTKILLSRAISQFPWHERPNRIPNPTLQVALLNKTILCQTLYLTIRINIMSNFVPDNQN